jgi:hypothetical protein
MLAMEELPEHLFARERELVSKEGTIITWEEGLAACERTLGRPYRERGVEHTQTEAIK